MGAPKKRKLKNYGHTTKLCVICGKPFKTDRRGRRSTCRPGPNALPGTSCTGILRLISAGRLVKKRPYGLRKIMLKTPGYGLIADPEDNIPPIIR